MTYSTQSIYDIFKLIVECSYDGIYVTDGKANTIFVNKSYENITGIPKRYLIGANMKKLVEEGYFSESGSIKAIEQKKEITLSQKLKSGKSIFVTSTPIFDKNKEIIYVMTNVRDMEELQRLEKELSYEKELTKKYRKEIEDIKKNHLYNENFITNNPKMQKALHLVNDVAKFDSSVLFQGETGTGKTYLARLLHQLSSRSENDFFEINCSSLPEGLVESELFGYEKGAFTGALASGKKGIFELADNSTLFLDEISELSLETQAKLLKVLESGRLLRIGGEKFININVRIISASNTNLLDLVREGKFRKDLYYRINVIQIELPPMRERKEDIPALLAKFLDFYNKKYNLNKKITKEVYDMLYEYSWPGNVREIRNLVEHMIIISTKDEIEYDDIPEYVLTTFIGKTNTKELENICRCCLELYSRMPLKEATDKFQKEIIELLSKQGNSKIKIAKLLDVNPSTITRKFPK
ncbi:MAG: sigma 54-interacting transcriptional regulator [Fusobacterium sp.]|nr:sigma 54-interacting transcriptional regulator [Fusobacterium sp.]